MEYRKEKILTLEEEASLKLLLKKLRQLDPETSKPDPFSVLDLDGDTKEDLREFNIRMSDFYLGAKLLLEDPEKYNLSQEERVIAESIVNKNEQFIAQSDEKRKGRNNVI